MSDLYHSQAPRQPQHHSRKKYNFHHMLLKHLSKYKYVRMSHLYKIDIKYISNTYFESKSNTWVHGAEDDKNAQTFFLFLLLGEAFDALLLISFVSLVFFLGNSLSCSLQLFVFSPLFLRQQFSRPLSLLTLKNVNMNFITILPQLRHINCYGAYC